jgi:hypothetical protein
MKLCVFYFIELCDEIKKNVVFEVPKIKPNRPFFLVKMIYLSHCILLLNLDKALNMIDKGVDKFRISSAIKISYYNEVRQVQFYVRKKPLNLHINLSRRCSIITWLYRLLASLLIIRYDSAVEFKLNELVMFMILLYCSVRVKLYVSSSRCLRVGQNGYDFVFVRISLRVRVALVTRNIRDTWRSFVIKARILHFITFFRLLAIIYNNCFPKFVMCIVVYFTFVCCHSLRCNNYSDINIIYGRAVFLCNANSKE